MINKFEVTSIICHIVILFPLSFLLLIIRRVVESILYLTPKGVRRKLNKITRYFFSLFVSALTTGPIIKKKKRR